jgi:hypothetical protein
MKLPPYQMDSCTSAKGILVIFSIISQTQYLACKHGNGTKSLIGFQNVGMLKYQRAHKFLALVWLKAKNSLFNQVLF